METTFHPRPWQRRLADTWLHPLHIARRSLLRTLATAAPVVHGRTLDLGCGSKRYRDLFPGVTSYLALDLPSNSAGERGVHVFGDGRFLPFLDASFDTVLCTEVVEHVPTPELVFGESARVLKPGGHLVLTTPQTWGLHEAPHDYYRYTEFGLRFQAERAGLRVVSVTPTCGVWATAGQRVSSFLFFEWGADRNLLVQGLAVGVCTTVQLASAGLDRLFRHRGDPLDHLLIAVK